MNTWSDTITKYIFKESKNVLKSFEVNSHNTILSNHNILTLVLVIDYWVIANTAQAVFSKGTQLNQFNLVTTRTPRYVFVDLLNRQSVSGLYWCTGLGFFPDAELHTCFCWSSWGSCSLSLLRSHCMAALPSSLLVSLPLPGVALRHALCMKTLSTLVSNAK